MFKDRVSLATVRRRLERLVVRWRWTSSFDRIDIGIVPKSISRSSGQEYDAEPVILNTTDSRASGIVR